MKLYLYFTGFRRIVCPKRKVTRFLNICMKYGYVYRDMKVGENGDISVTASIYTANRIKSKCEFVEVEKVRGLPSMFIKAGAHLGAVLGCAVAVAAIVFSGSIIWDVRVSGNELISDAEVCKILSECGFDKGSPTLVDTDLIENSAMLRCDDIAWISVNISGTVAYVEMREKIPVDSKEDAPSPANVVASHDGKITEYIVYRGVSNVKVGEYVREGDLLISGVIGNDKNAKGVQVTRAAGSVTAKTEREFTVEIPYEYSVKKYTGAKKSDIFVKFFSKTLKVFSNSRNFDVECDKIEKEKTMSFFGSDLPLTVSRRDYLGYEIETAYYTAHEAEAIAREKLDELIDAELGGAKILSRTTVGTAGETSFTVSCKITCIEEIAKTQEFEFFERENG